MNDDEQRLLIRIDERLGHHVNSTAAWQEETTGRIKEIDIKMARDNVRLDRIEQTEAGRAKLAWVALTAAVAAIAASVRGWLLK